MFVLMSLLTIRGLSGSESEQVHKALSKLAHFHLYILGAGTKEARFVNPKSTTPTSLWLLLEALTLQGAASTGMEGKRRRSRKQ